MREGRRKGTPRRGCSGPAQLELQVEEGEEKTDLGARQYKHELAGTSRCDVRRVEGSPAELERSDGERATAFGGVSHGGTTGARGERGRRQGLPVWAKPEAR